MDRLKQDKGVGPIRSPVAIERRSMLDRRLFSYYAHIPERRSGIDRRRGRGGTVTPRT